MVGVSKESDERGTPAWLIREFHNALGGLFDLDPAAGAEPIRTAEKRYTKQDNGLAHPWNADSVWLNPPYSEPKKWMRKVQRELARDDPEAPEFVVALMRGDCSTEWFQKYGTGEYICLVSDRISFTNTGDSPRSSNFLIGFGNLPEAVLDVFEQLGAVYRRKTVLHAHEQGRLDDLASDGGMGATRASGPVGTSVSLDRLQPYEQVTLTFPTDRLGTVHDLPPEVTVEVMPDNPEFDADDGKITVDCIGPNALPDGGDLYLQIQESAYTASRTVAAVAPYGNPWVTAAVETISPTHRETAPTVQA